MNLRKGLVGYWTMDDRDVDNGLIRDRSVFEGHGDLLNGVTTGVDAPIGQGCGFDGDDDTVDAENNGWNTDEITIVLWARTTEDTGTENDNAVFSTDGGDNDLLLQFSSNRLRFWGRTYPESNTAHNFDFEVGEWYHIAVVYKYGGSEVEFYVNGDRSVETGDEFGIPGRETFHIGSRRGSSRTFPGDIANVRVYNRTLSEEEIKALYDMRSLRRQTNNLAKGLVGHWTLDNRDTDNGMVWDRSGNDFHGTIEGNTRTGEDGVVGDAFDFEGGGNYVETDIQPSDVGIDGNAPKTVAAWARITDFGNNGGLWEIGTEEDSEEFSLRVNGEPYKFRAQLWSSGDFDFSHDARDTWAHYVLLHDGGVTKVYIDGELIESQEQTINTTDGKPFRIARWNSDDRTIEGRMDDVRLYNRVLSEDEIRMLYYMRN